MRWIYPAGLSAMLLLGGCGGSDTADNTTLNTRTGIFVDSPVDGLIFARKPWNQRCNEQWRSLQISGEIETYL